MQRTSFRTNLVDLEELDLLKTRDMALHRTSNTNNNNFEEATDAKPSSGAMVRFALASLLPLICCCACAWGGERGRSQIDQFPFFPRSSPRAQHFHFRKRRNTRQCNATNLMGKDIPQRSSRPWEGFQRDVHARRMRNRTRSGAWPFRRET